MLFYPFPNSSSTVEAREDFRNRCPAADDTVAKSEGPHRTRGSAKGEREKAATRGRSGFTGSRHPAGRTGATPWDIYSCRAFAKYLQSDLLVCCCPGEDPGTGARTKQNVAGEYADEA